MNGWGADGNHRSRLQRLREHSLRLVCGLGMLGSSSPFAHSAEPAELSVGVKQVVETVEASDSAPRPPVPRATTPPPATPGGKLPQYQFDHWHRELPSSARIGDPRLRLLLALPTQPLLVEVSITIDGRPFHEAREQRISSILEELAQPAPAEPVFPINEFPEPPVSAVRTENTENEPEPPPVQPPTVSSYRFPSSVSERLRRQQLATGRAPSREEIRWLLTNWIDGPTLLMLQENFQRFRANERPAFFVLDRDRDGRISPEEISACVESFRECEFNRNDIIEYTELERAAADPRQRQAGNGGSGQLIFSLPTVEIADTTYQQLANRYGVAGLTRFDRDGDGAFNPEEIVALQASPPDLLITVTFQTTAPEESRISISGLDEQGRPIASTGSTVGNEIELIWGGTPIVVSALQGRASDQISLGAVVDGYPILPHVDPRPDGRITLRELRVLKDRLLKLDRNGDGEVTDDEAAATIRLCFGLGPVVHSELSLLRNQSVGSLESLTTGPDWFVRMDRNRDYDLTRSEFPGTDEQFAALDRDGDELVSSEEAREFDRTMNPPHQATKPVNEPASASEPANSPATPTSGN